MDYLEELFRHWEENGTDSEELHHALTEIYPETCEKEQEVLLRCVSAERRNAFKAGFDCAVQLLKMGKEQEYPGEEWRKIEGYENYSVSNYGRVRNDTNGRIRRNYKTKHGYMQTTFGMGKRNKVKHFLVHVLVAKAFIPNPNNKPFVNHINENKSDNRAENLEWVTFAENVRYSFELHRDERIAHLKQACTLGGGAHGQGITVYKDGVFFGGFPSLRQAAQTLHIDSKTIKRYALNGKTHPKGYTFQLKEK